METTAANMVDVQTSLEAIEAMLGAGRVDDALLTADQLLESVRLTPGGPALEDEVRALLLRARARRVWGRQKDGRADVRRAVALCLDAGDDPRTRRLVVQSWRAVAELLRERGLYRGAERVLRVLVARAQAWFGYGDPDVGRCLNEMGMVLGYLGRKDDAQRCFADALLIFGVDGEEESAMSVMLNLAHLYCARGRLADAEDLSRRGLALRLSLTPHAVVAVASNRLCLATILGVRGRLDEAARNCHDALRVFREAYGPDHIEVGNCLHVLALITADAGDSIQARAMFTEALRIKRLRLGARHPELLSPMLRLAQISDSGQRSALVSEAERVAMRLPPAHWLRQFVVYLARSSRAG
jgi:tetratricopeptide (TPR) repeat protein